MKESVPGNVRLRPLLIGVIALFSVVVFSRVIIPAFAEPNFGITGDELSGGWTSDFAGILTFVRALWVGEAGYDVESHLRVTSERAGRSVQHALPFGYPPTVLWVLGPLCLLPTVWAYVIWTVLGVSAASWIILRGSSIWLAVAFFTPLSFTCFKLGQTAFLTAAGFFFLIRVSLRHRSSDTPAGPTSTAWRETLVLWALSAKPPLAVTASAALLSLGRWKPVAQAAVLTLVSIVLLIPVLGVGWVPQYLTIVTHYDLDTANAAFTWSIVPEAMGNLRALLHSTLGIGDSIASRLSSALWLLSLIGIFVAGRRGELGLERCWSLVVLAFLLFCPHVTATEDLHLVLVLALVSFQRTRIRPNLLWTIIGLVLATLFFGSGLGYQGQLRIPIVFGAKAMLAAMICLPSLFGSSQNQALSDTRRGGA